MIDRVLNFLLAELNIFLGMPMQSSEPLAVLSSLTNLDGTISIGIENKIIISLVNVEREAAAGSLAAVNRTPSEIYSRVNPPLSLNLSVLVSASFPTNYGEALRLLSRALACFQAKQSFNAQNSPSLPREIARLSLDLMSLNTQDMNYLWSILGTKYLPSALYKVRMLMLQEGHVLEQTPRIQATESQVKR